MTNRLIMGADRVPQLGGAPIHAFAPGATQNIAFTTASTLLTNPLAADTRLIEVTATADCYVKIATGSPTAAAADTLVLAGTTRLFAIVVNDGAIKVAAIGRVASGILNVVECN